MMKTVRKKSVFPDCYLWVICFTYGLAFVFNLMIFAFICNQAISKMNSFTVLLPQIRILGIILLSFCFFSSTIIVYMWNSLFLGKLKKIRTGIVMMSVLLVLNLIMCLVTGAFLIFSTYKSSEDKMMNSIVNYHFEEKNVENIDALQQELQCCGVDNYMDWRFNKKYKCLASGIVPSKCGVPASCCKTIKEFPIDENCGIGVLNKPELTSLQWNETMGIYEKVYNLRSKAAAPEIINTNGCKEGIIKHLHKSGINIILLTLALIAVQTICIFFQCQAMHYFIKRRRLLTSPSAVFYRARTSDVFIISKSPELSSGAKQSDETESSKKNHNTSLLTYPGGSSPTKSSKTCFNVKKLDEFTHSTSCEASLKEKTSLDCFASKKSAMLSKSQSSDLFIDARIPDAFHDSTQSESKMLRLEHSKNRMHDSSQSRDCTKSKDSVVALKDKTSLLRQNEPLAFRSRSPMNSKRVKNVLASSKEKKSQLKSSNYAIEEDISTPSKFEIEQQATLRGTKPKNILPSSKAKRNQLEIFRKYSGTGCDLVPSNVKMNQEKSSINCTRAKYVSPQTEAETSLPGTSKNYSSAGYVFKPRKAERMQTEADYSSAGYVFKPAERMKTEAEASQSGTSSNYSSAGYVFKPRKAERMQTEAEASLPGTSRNYSSAGYVFKPKKAERVQTEAETSQPGTSRNYSSAGYVFKPKKAERVQTEAETSQPGTSRNYSSAGYVFKPKKAERVQTEAETSQPGTSSNYSRVEYVFKPRKAEGIQTEAETSLPGASRNYSLEGYVFRPIKAEPGTSSNYSRVEYVFKPTKAEGMQTEAETSLPETSRNYSIEGYVFKPLKAEKMQTKAGKSCTNEENTVLSLKIKTSRSEISSRHSGAQTKDEMCQPGIWDSFKGKEPLAD